MEYSYYPGCSLHGTSKDYAKSIECISNKLDIKLIELKDWVCCGASPAHVPYENLNLAIPALDLAEANKHDRDLVAVCAACFNRLKTTQAFLDKNVKKKVEIENLIETKLSKTIKVRHFLEVISEDIKKEEWQNKIKKNLKELKVASYYGCLLSRPGFVMNEKNYENPDIMDNLMELIGAKPVSWSYKTECCGASFGVSKPDIVLNLANKILKAAKNAGAECIVVACPLCQVNLDLRQKEIEKLYDIKLDLPIFYFSELIAIALGEDYNNLLLDKHIIDTLPLLKKKELI